MSWFLCSATMLFDQNNTTWLIKLLQQQSFMAGLKKMIFCQPTIFVFCADPAMNIFSLYLIDANIEHKK